MVRGAENIGGSNRLPVIDHLFLGKLGSKKGASIRRNLEVGACEAGSHLKV